MTLESRLFIRPKGAAICVFSSKAEKETGEENWEINYKVQPQMRFNQTFVVYLLQTLDHYWTAHFVIRIWPRAKCDTEAIEEQSFQVHTAWAFELQLPQNIKNHAGIHYIPDFL